ncbi:hypothetical protein VKT23_019192 [Stygiomarasmius scandens]|uniref:Uncharacterized protein n=1 Tax=Marasmiellus scandens TaxID=2682957 RepID=A0ABR1IRC1_9AGAR
MALTFTQPDLTRNKDSSAVIAFTDGLVAGIHERTGTFISSPNCYTIPRPPFGSTRDLYRRADARYGEDDPLQWPQPFNPNNAYLTCIPIHPVTPDNPYHEHDCLWHTLRPQDLSFTPHKYGAQEGVLNHSLTDRLSNSVNQVLLRKTAFHPPACQSDWIVPLLNEFNTTITVCMNRLTSVSSSFRNHTEGLVELQRACLYSFALMDYVEIFLPRISSQGNVKNGRTEHRMGAFVWNDEHALSLFAAGLPVYYVRLWSDFDRQNILNSCQLEIPPCVASTASPPYPIIYSGQAGSDQKFAAIRHASISCYNVTSPFENMHLPGQYSSSYTIGSGKRIISAAQSPASTSACGVLQLPHAPKVHRDIYADLPSDHPYISPSIPAWRNANKTINIWHPDCHYTPGQLPKIDTIVPDPALIIGPETRERQESYLSQWAHIRSAWLQRCRIRQPEQRPLTASMWRRILGLGLSGPWTGGAPQSVREEEHKEATDLVASMLSEYAPEASPLSVSDLQQAKELMRELSLINFRYQLLCVDELMDTSKPKASPALTRAELGVALMNHHRSRLMLIEHMFGGSGDTFTVPTLSSNFGFMADKWQERVKALRSFWKLMSSWPGTKDSKWSRGEDENLSQMPAAGEEWERALVSFYTQTHFIAVGYPPVLPLRI